MRNAGDEFGGGDGDRGRRAIMGAGTAGCRILVADYVDTGRTTGCRKPMADDFGGGSTLAGSVDGDTPIVDPGPLLLRHNLHTESRGQELAGPAGTGAGRGSPARAGRGGPTGTDVGPDQTVAARQEQEQEQVRTVAA